jgi:uncharacterized protein (DUF952 family)
MIYHITTASNWDSQKVEPDYVPLDYLREGFVHCCTAEQLVSVRERYFKGTSGLVLLHIDESKLKPELKFEASTNHEEFPHVCGPINRDAIIVVMPI